jgi:hypothetical protein
MQHVAGAVLQPVGRNWCNEPRGPARATARKQDANVEHREPLIHVGVPMI